MHLSSPDPKEGDKNRWWLTVCKFQLRTRFSDGQREPTLNIKKQRGCIHISVHLEFPKV